MDARQVLAVLLLTGLAGCSAAGPIGPAKEAEAQTATLAGPSAGGAGTGYQPNQWLLDSFHPSAVSVSNGAEPSILTDRLGRALWIGDTSGTYVSLDNGTSWHVAGHYVGDVGVAFGDGVALAQDDTGRLYAAILNDNRVDVVSSSDLGATWDTLGVAAGVSGTADRPWLAADGDGEVVLFYFDAPAVAVGLWEHCARSTDAGMTFVDREPVSIIPGTGGKAFFDGQGRFYFAHNSGSLYRYDSTCMGSSRTIPMLDDTGGPNQMLQGAADGTDLYMVGTDSGGRIVLAGSRDGGGVRDIVVSPAFLPTNTYSTVAARDGLVAVAWYGSETGGDPSAPGYQGAFNVYVALVRGFWQDTSVEYYRLTAAPNHVGDICMSGIGCTGGSGDRDLLDYFMVDLDVWGGIHVAYGNDGDSSQRAVAYGRIPPGIPGVSLDVPAGVVDIPDELPPQPNADGVSPTASFIAKVRGYAVGVDGSTSIDPQDSDLSFEWTFGDGASATGPRANHTYARHGAFAITLKATDPEGHVGQSTRNVLVDGSGDLPPTPRVAVSPAQPVEGQIVTLRDTSTDADGRVVAREWAIGTKRSTEQAVQVKLAAGTHTVKLTVTDDVGVSASTSVSVTVLPPPDRDGDGIPDPVSDGDEGPVSVKLPSSGFILALAAAGVALAMAAGGRGPRRP
ncbi:MAG TPA: PKD domain-containing protein [Candidatus Thermoplasmatota archaeon]|nr:PKD domain-containing protein [Candidatus Thermoplasmatota archaeon]